jgi:hypothetical protein
MQRIVIITHVYDDFRSRSYLLRSLIGYWTAAGYGVSLTAGLDDLPEADIAILHVDLSVMPAAYAAASKRYPIVVNGAVHDIRKNIVSRHLVRPSDGWTGPVIIKTDLNCGGVPEQRILQLCQQHGKAPDFMHNEIVSTTRPYPILRSASEVPDAVWRNPGLVVERFLPEQDAQGFWMRVWVFFGDRERCTRFRGNHPIVKRDNIIGRERASVPDKLREERDRLGFDYGKFDFVVRDDEVILFDANRTPAAPPLSPELEKSNANLARGLESLMSKVS